STATNLLGVTRRTADSPPVRPRSRSGGITPWYDALCEGAGLALLRREDRAVRTRWRHEARAGIVPGPPGGLAADQLLAVRRPPHEIRVRVRVGRRVGLEQERPGPVGAIRRRAVHGPAV